MQVEFSLTVPPDRNLVRFRMNDHQLSALIDLFMDDLENNRGSHEPLMADMGDSSTETGILERLERTLPEKHARQFKKILKEHRLSETEVCRKYGTSRIADLTGGDALDIIVKDILPKLEHENSANNPQ